jgi:hypothetical protein
MKLTDSILQTLAAALEVVSDNNGLDFKDLNIAKSFVAAELKRRARVKKRELESRASAEKREIKALARAEKKAKMQTFSHMSPARRKWLQRLAENGPQTHGQGKVYVDCAALGWTAWDISLPDGTPISEKEARKRFGDEWPKSVRVFPTEHITQAGLDALADYVRLMALTRGM